MSLNQVWISQKGSGEDPCVCFFRCVTPKGSTSRSEFTVRFLTLWHASTRLPTSSITPLRPTGTSPTSSQRRTEVNMRNIPPNHHLCFGWNKYSENWEFSPHSSREGQVSPLTQPKVPKSVKWWWWMNEWLICASSLSNVFVDIDFFVFLCCLTESMLYLDGKRHFNQTVGCNMSNAWSLYLSKSFIRVLITEFICAEVQSVQEFSFIITPLSVYTLITWRPGSVTLILLFGLITVSEDFDT